MTDILRYSVSAKHKKKVQEALDKWKQRGPIQSDKICQAIIKLHEEEEKGNKLDTYSKEPTPLDLFPKVTESWTFDELSKYDVEDLQRVNKLTYKRQEELRAYFAQLAKLR